MKRQDQKSPFVDNMVLCLRDPKNFTRKLELSSKFSNVICTYIQTDTHRIQIILRRPQNFNVDHILSHKLNNNK